MKNFKCQKGFTVVEALVVATIIAVVIVMAGSLSSKFASRRGIDNLAYRITSTFNLVRLQSSRNGVEYQANLNYDNTNNKLTIETKRGDSNRFSDFPSITPSSSEELSVAEDYEIILGTSSIEFNPNQTIGGSGTIQIKPVDATSNIKKCGVIVINPFGRIRTVIGNWDFAENECKAIYDGQAQPG